MRIRSAVTDDVRAYAALAVFFVVGTGLVVVVVALARAVQPGSELVRRGRLPGWSVRLTAWARSRSLRLWCPNDVTAATVAGHLKDATGRRLSRLGVSIASGPGGADVVVIDQRDAARLDAWRAEVAVPNAAVTLVDAGDATEFTDAIIALSMALRWPDEVEST